VGWSCPWDHADNGKETEEIGRELIERNRAGSGHLFEGNREGTLKFAGKQKSFYPLGCPKGLTERLNSREVHLPERKEGEILLKEKDGPGTGQKALENGTGRSQ